MNNRLIDLKIGRWYTEAGLIDPKDRMGPFRFRLLYRGNGCSYVIHYGYYKIWDGTIIKWNNHAKCFDIKEYEKK